MAEKQIQLRRGDSADWTSANPVLLLGEVGLEFNDGDFVGLKIGDDVTAWLALPYFATATLWGDIGGTLADQTDLQAALDAKADATDLADKADAADVPAWVVKAGADSSNSTTALADCAELSFTAVAGASYVVELQGVLQTAATTTGIAIALKIPSGSVAGHAQHTINATQTGSCEQIADDATSGATAGMRAATTDVPAFGRWMVNIGGTGGTVQLRFRSEIATSAVTIKGGGRSAISFVRIA